MISPAIYLIKVILISGILYGYYAFALRNERFHQWNRYYLIFSVAASLVIPFIRWSALSSYFFPGEPAYIARIQTFTANVVTVSASSPGHLSGPQWMIVLYGLLVLIFASGVVAGLVKIFTRVRYGQKEEFPLFTLVKHPKTNSPFSFFRYIFWSENIPMSSTRGEHILRHEVAHVTEKHSLDKLYMELVTCLFWINPFFYLIRSELHTIHEFLADKKACENNTPQEYATLLVEQALQRGNMALASPFFQKQLSRRVHMLIRENKNRFTYFKRLMAIPLTLLVVFCFLYVQSYAGVKDVPLLSNIYPTEGRPSTTTKASAPLLSLFTNRETSDHNHNAGTASLHSPDTPKAEETATATGKIFTFVERMPSFPGGEHALVTYLNRHIQYPTSAKEQGVQGTVVVQFIVGTDGTIRDAHPVAERNENSALGKEAVRVVQGMPRWNPGQQDGRPVTVQYNLPVRFVLNADAISNTGPSTSASEPPPPPPPAPLPNVVLSQVTPPSAADKVFTFVEQMPSFPDGEGALMKYLSQHIRYPADAREYGIQGTVVVQFIVGVDGKLSDVKTVGPVKGGGLEQEAVRVVSTMPPWLPGKQNGKKVAVQYNLPIRFVLQ